MPTAGLEVFERVRRFTGKSTPSILLSEDLEIPSATELASLTVLTKPVTEMKLSRAIEQALVEMSAAN